MACSIKQGNVYLGRVISSGVWRHVVWYISLWGFRKNLLPSCSWSKNKPKIEESSRQSKSENLYLPLWCHFWPAFPQLSAFSNTALFKANTSGCSPSCYWFSLSVFLLATFRLLGLLFDSEDGGSTSLRNVGTLPDYTGSHSRRSVHSHRCENLRSKTLALSLARSGRLTFHAISGHSSFFKAQGYFCNKFEDV
jgi:hypothetical protein